MSEAGELKRRIAELEATVARLSANRENVPEAPTIGAEWDDRLRSGRFPPAPVSFNRASSIGESCLRKLYYRRIGADRKPLEVGTLGIFSMGNEIERMQVMRLLSMGYIVERAQEVWFYLDWTDEGKILWRGHPDGILTHPYWYPGRRWVADVKSINGQTFRDIPYDPMEAAEWLRDAKSTWVRKYPYQVIAYVLAHRQMVEGGDLEGSHLTCGLLLFVCKDSGRVKIAKVDPTVEDQNLIIRRARTVDLAVSTKAPPAFCSDPEACERCEFFDLACDPVVVVKGQRIIDPKDEGNADIIAAVPKYLALEYHSKQFKRIERTVKSRFKRMEDGVYELPGKWQVSVKRSRDGKVFVRPGRIEDDGRQNESGSGRARGRRK